MMRGYLATASVLSSIAATIAVIAAPPPTYHLAVDVPARLGGVDYTTHQVVLQENYNYSVATSLPPDLQINALHRFKNGWWISPAEPTELCGVTYEPRDIIELRGPTCTLVLDGSAVGIPDSSRIDAITQQLVGLNALTVVSFDVPTTIGPRTYQPFDLARNSGGTTWVLTFDGAAAGIPAGANVIGADVRSGLFHVNFDVPVTLGSITYTPGQIARWDGAVWWLAVDDSMWPSSVQVHDFAFSTGANPVGTVPDGSTVLGTPLTLTKKPGPPDQLVLSWGVPCNGLTAETDFEVYRGKLENWYSHEPVACSTGFALSYAEPLAGSTSHYYLVVARNPEREGSYGVRSDGSQRPASVSACAVQDISACP